MSDNSVIYGFHAVTAFILKHPDRIALVRIDEHRYDGRMQRLLEVVGQQGVKLETTSRKNLELEAGHKGHQGVVALIKPWVQSSDLEEFLEKVERPFLLVLDGVQDPHNLGACLRTANAAGVDAVIAPRDRAAGITSVVTKVASGATLHTPFFQVANLARSLQLLKNRAVWLYGTSEHAQQLYNQVTLTGSLAVVMGSEGQGLRRLTEELCDFLIRIPLYGTVPSLNVSVATGICLFEVVRQNATANK